jgi:hypothetical protein
MFQSAGGRLNVRALVDTNSETIAPGSHRKSTSRRLRFQSFEPHAAYPITSVCPYSTFEVASNTSRSFGSRIAVLRSHSSPVSFPPDMSITTRPRFCAASDRSIMAFISSKS